MHLMGRLCRCRDLLQRNRLKSKHIRVQVSVILGENSIEAAVCSLHATVFSSLTRGSFFFLFLLFILICPLSNLP